MLCCLAWRVERAAGAVFGVVATGACLLQSFMQDYHQLEIWNRAMDYAVRVYEFAAALPAEEKYNLAPQLQRAVTSAPLNIAEGCGSASNSEFGRFLSYAYRSLKETVTALELCQRLYPARNADRAGTLIDEGNQISRMTYTLLQKVAPEPDSRSHH
jgi:four helix bundle protein